MSQASIVEGVFAVQKPQGLTSADVVRRLQTAFNPSALFAPWLEAERAVRDREAQNQQRRRKKHKRLDVKIGHGGTLDPLATGVLIIGVGRGTKALQSFLECTKTYETVCLFGVGTDTYDVLGKVVARDANGGAGVTRAGVEKALDSFKGKILQKPPVYSALRINGKRLYEYAREGKTEEIEAAIKSREVEVREIELVDWLEGGQHEHRWPAEEAGQEEKAVVEKVLQLKTASHGSEPASIAPHGSEPAGIASHGSEPAGIATEQGQKRKRVHSEEEALQDHIVPQRPSAKVRLSRDNDLMSGALQPPSDDVDQSSLVHDDSNRVQTATDTTSQAMAESSPEAAATAATTDTSSPQLPADTTEGTAASSAAIALPITSTAHTASTSTTITTPTPAPPAARIRMTVTSGFYVRSLCHDLGQAVGSLGIMAALSRSRQGDYELGRNVLEWADLQAGEDVWAPKVKAALEEWQRRRDGSLEKR